MRILTAAFWGIVLFLNPFRSCLLNDEWAYMLPVERLLRDGVLRPSSGAAPTGVLEILWGALFCLPFGFSHGALRLSVLALAWVGLLAFFKTLLRLGLDRTQGLAGALCLLFNPVFLLTSMTFTTDVPCLALLLAAGHELVAGLQDRDRRRLALSSVLSGLAYWFRQTGAALPFGAVLWMILSGRRDRRDLAALLAPVLLATAAHGAWTAAAGLPYAQKDFLVLAALERFRDLPLLWSEALRRAAGASVYAGLFLAPFVAAAVAAGSKRAGRFGPAAFALPVLWALLLAMRQPPFIGLTLGPYGLGPCTSPGDCAFKAAGLFSSPAFWDLLVAFGLLASASLAVSARGDGAMWKTPWGAYAAGLGSAWAATLIAPFYYDRYLLPLFPPLIAWAAAKWRRRRLSFALPGAFMAFWAVAGTWDYLAWNSARWAAGHRLHEQGFAYAEIGNELAWDSYFGFEAMLAARLRGSSGDRPALSGWNDPSRFRAFVSFSPSAPTPGLEPAGVEPYWSPLVPGRRLLHLWKRR